MSAIYAAVAQRVTASGAHQHPVMSRSSADADFALGVAGTDPK